MAIQVSNEGARRPNIIFILADDLGYGDLACYGHPYAKTPHIDQMAKEGRRFSRFYVSDARCSPSRASFLTSRHSASFEQETAKYGLGDQPTIMELLQARGYITGHFGKWHLGPIPRDANPYGIDVLKTVTPKGHQDKTKDEVIFDDAIQFMAAHKDQPFYINLWTHATHFPFSPKVEHKKVFSSLRVRKKDFGYWMRKNKISHFKNNVRMLSAAMRIYLGEIYALDQQIGRITAWLEENDLADNTILVITSDNGPANMPEEGIDAGPERNLLGSTGELRGGKTTHFEGGIRVPFIIKWPAKIAPHTLDTTGVYSALDWLPSLCAITGTDIKKLTIDGEDRSAGWLGKPKSRSKALFWKEYQKNAPVTILDNPWKLVQRDTGERLLFHLDQDPSERRDLAEDKPEIVHQLLTQIEAWEKGLPERYTLNPADSFIQALKSRGMDLTSEEEAEIREIGKKYGFDEHYQQDFVDRKPSQKNYQAFKQEVKSTVLKKVLERQRK